MSKPSVICITPVKNEAWILERFLQCASVWADHIIIADQGSTDGSREIARRFSKVRLIDNTSQAFNEPERQQMLLEEARRIPGPRILLALDADEFLTANFARSVEWNSILNAVPGTVISFKWPQIQLVDSELKYFHLPGEKPIGFVDDGSQHVGRSIHSNRVPTPPGSPGLVLSEIKLMHYALLDFDRYRSKLRWYQCHEHLAERKGPLQLYRYYHVYLVPGVSLHPVPKEWIDGYREHDIDMTSMNRAPQYWWDREVLQFFEKYGARKFRRMGIWEADWSEMYRGVYPDNPPRSYPDPRSSFDKIVHRWLRRTQKDFVPDAAPPFGRRVAYQIVHRALGLFGW
jgi:hypothetical protein